MRKRKRRVNALAIMIAAVLAFSSAGMTAFADLSGEMPAEEVVIEEETSAAAEEEAEESVEEEIAEEEAAEEETPEAVEEEAAEEEAKESLEEEIPEEEAAEEETPEEEAAEEEPPEAEELVEVTDNEEIREEKLEDTYTFSFNSSFSIGVRFVGQYELIPTSRYLSNYSSMAGNVSFEKIAGPSWVTVNPTNGKISSDPEAPYVNTPPVLKIKVTNNSDSSNYGIGTFSIGPVYMHANQRSGLYWLGIYCPSLFYRLEYGRLLPSLRSLTTDNSYYTVTGKWQKRSYDQPDDEWEDCASSEYVDNPNKVYRIYFTIRHSYKATGNIEADNENQSYEFNEDSFSSIYYGSPESPGSSSGVYFEDLVPAEQEGTSVIYAFSETFLPLYPFSCSLNPEEAADSVVVGDGTSYYQLDYEKEQGIHTGGDGESLYIKVTPEEGYAFYSFVDALGKEWLPEELHPSWSGNTVTLCYYLGSNPERCCGVLKFNFVKLPAGISLPANETLTLGAVKKLKAVVTPSDCTMPVSWSSTNSSVASVDEEGNVTALEFGTAAIKASITYGSETREARCNVTVERPEMKITAFANTTKGVILTWQKVPGATDYTVSRLIAGNTIGDIVGSGITGNSFTDSPDGLKSGTQYEYEVYARKGTKTLCYSSARWYYIGTTTMNAPTCIAKGLRVTWPKVEGAQKYVIFRHVGTGTPDWKYVTTIAATDAATQTYNTASAAGLIPGSWYAYTVRAIGADNTYGGQPAGRSVRFREPVKLTKIQSISNGVRGTFTTVAAGYTYGLYRADVVNGKTGTYSLIGTITNTSVGKDAWIYDTSAVNGKTYSYYVRCLSKDLAVPLSSYANAMQITYKKP